MLKNIPSVEETLAAAGRFYLAGHRFQQYSTKRPRSSTWPLPNGMICPFGGGFISVGRSE
jgi:hypothetical protein